jgi:hypothetical protein
MPSSSRKEIPVGASVENSCAIARLNDPWRRLPQITAMLIVSVIFPQFHPFASDGNACFRALARTSMFI